jgi:hypothetical protein
MRSLVLSMCVLASPALAEDFLLIDGQGVSFATHSAVSGDAADVSVQGNVVHAKHGVKREKGREQLASSTGLSLRDVLLVRDGHGNFHRVRIDTQLAGLTHLIWFEDKDRAAAFARGGYENTRITVNGEVVESSFGRLVLDEKGRFTLGRAKGTWASIEGRLTLSTFDALWGYPMVLDHGDTLIFEFSRGSLKWQVRFERSATANEARVASVD